MIILERHSVVTSLAIKESPEIMKNKSTVAQMIPYPSWGTAVPRSRFVPLSGFVPRSGPDPDLMNNVRTWTSNFTHSLKGDAITHQCLNFNGGLLKSLLNYGYGCIIISHCFTFMKLLIHVVTQSHDHGHELLLPFWMTPSGLAHRCQTISQESR